MYPIDSFLKNINYQKLLNLKEFLNEVDIIFTAYQWRSTKISKYLLKNTLIDLSADFRLNKSSDYLKWYKQKHKL